ncbi:MAG TPA: DUF4412 domain-containing protein [Anaeromyxobacteraceae bacterium]|nr:DUF4412 domain-containing protein [Anaeromyxobacteraceae bacterium]
MNTPRLALLIALASLPIAVRADVIITLEEPQGHSILSFEGTKVRIDHFSGSGPAKVSVIFDGSARVLYQLDPANKVATRLDEASGKQVAARMREAMERAEAGMTPEQRTRFEAAMGHGQGDAQSNKPHVWKFERASGSETVAGYRCDRFRVIDNGNPTEEGCFIPWSAGAVQKPDLVAFQEMGKFVENIMSSLRSSATRGPQESSNERIAMWFDQAPGFPAVIAHLNPDGKSTRIVKLQKIERATVPADRFRVPPGYREESAAEKMGTHQ